MEFPLFQYYLNNGPHPNKPSDVTVTCFSNPQKFWIRRIKATDTLITVLELVKKSCSANCLKRPRKERNETIGSVCKNQSFCVYHEQSKNHGNKDCAIVWNVPDNPKDPLCILANKIMKKYGLQKGDLVYARSRYIQNEENNLYECDNRVIIETAYLPEEEFISPHLLVQFIDEGENHTEWIPISDISMMSIADKQQYLEESALEDVATLSVDTQDYQKFVDLSNEQFHDSCTLDSPAAQLSNSDANFSLCNVSNDVDRTLTNESFELIDDNIYCGNLKDFGLQPGGVILARCNKIKDTSTFHRGKIIDMHFQETLGLHLQIFFYDYGNTEWIHILDTRLMPKELMEIPPLAEEVSLYNLYPTWIFEPNEEPSSHGWSQKACQHFMRMVSTGDLPNLSEEDSHSYVELPNGNQEYYVPRALRLQTYETVANKKYVDIFHYPIEKEQGLVNKGDPVSVRDILLYMGLGCMADPRKFHQPSIATNEPGCNTVSLKSLRNLFEEGSFSAVRISHMESPAEIYVQPLNNIPNCSKSTEALLERIGKELELFYEKIYACNPYVIEEPIVGTLCAVKRYGIHGNGGRNNDVYGKRWYRCIIENVPYNTRLIEVYLIDVGCRYMTTPGKYLYLLNLERFVDRYEYALCFPVRLDNIIQTVPNFVKEPKYDSKMLFQCSNRYDTSEVLNNFAERIFVMHVVKNDNVFNQGYMEEWEVEEYPSVSLLREVSPWDGLIDLSMTDSEKDIKKIICVNSLLNFRKLIGQGSSSLDIDGVDILRKKCDNLTFTNEKVCSHPTIKGPMIRWIASKLESNDMFDDTLT